MTTRFLFTLQTTMSVTLLLWVVSCEEPTQKANQLVPPALKAENETVVSGDIPKNAGVDAVPQTGSVVKKKSEPKPPEHPYFHIYRENDTIVMEGALKSKIQIEEIAREMSLFFPELKIDNRMKREPHRHAVGWGNRVGNACLGDYFALIKNPAITYEGGTVTLTGVAKNPGDHRKVSELAISAFSDTWTDNLVNEIKVGG